jgi:hypothetical protein
MMLHQPFDELRRFKACVARRPAGARSDPRIKLLIHGARAALPHIAERDTALGRWAKGLLARVHQNVAVVALANELARIVWAMLRHGGKFAAKGLPVAA